MMTNLIIDDMAPTNRRLLIWLLISLALIVYGQFPLAKRYHADIFTNVVAGIVVALATTSFGLDAKERKKEAALTRFWRAFGDRVCIVLPAFEPKSNKDFDELSTFTLYHDAVASHEIQVFLQSRYRVRAQVISSKQVAQPRDLPNHNLILIGGPNFNDVTRIFMDELWKKYQGEFFHWSSMFKADQSLKDLVKREGDHLLKAENPDGSGMVVGEEIFDVACKDGKNPAKARGMCVRAEGIFGDDRTVVLFAGVDTAFGTLAAARYCLNGPNLVRIALGKVTQAIVDANVNGYNVGTGTALRILRSHEVVSEE
jgi:hypothetical protein